MGKETWNSPDVTNLTGHSAGIQLRDSQPWAVCPSPISCPLGLTGQTQQAQTLGSVLTEVPRACPPQLYKYLADFLQQDNHRRPVLTHSAPSPHTSEASAGVPRPFTLPYHRGGGLKLDFRCCSHHALQNTTSLWAILLRIPRLGQQGKQLWVASSGNLSNLIYCFCKKILLS